MSTTTSSNGTGMLPTEENNKSSGSPSPSLPYCHEPNPAGDSELRTTPNDHRDHDAQERRVLDDDEDDYNPAATIATAAAAKSSSSSSREKPTSSCTLTKKTSTTTQTSKTTANTNKNRKPLPPPPPPPQCDELGLLDSSSSSALSPPGHNNIRLPPPPARPATMCGANNTKRPRSLPTRNHTTTKEGPLKKSKTFFIGNEDPHLKVAAAAAAPSPASNNSKPEPDQPVQQPPQLQSTENFVDLSSLDEHEDDDIPMCDAAAKEDPATTPRPSDGGPSTVAMEATVVPEQLQQHHHPVPMVAVTTTNEPEPPPASLPPPPPPPHRVGIRSPEMRFIDAIVQRLTGREQAMFKAIAASAMKRHDARHPDDGTTYDHLPRAILRNVRERMEPTDYMGAYSAAWAEWTATRTDRPKITTATASSPGVAHAQSGLTMHQPTSPERNAGKNDWSDSSQSQKSTTKKSHSADAAIPKSAMKASGFVPHNKNTAKKAHFADDSLLKSAMKSSGYVPPKSARETSVAATNRIAALTQQKDYYSPQLDRKAILTLDGKATTALSPPPLPKTMASRPFGEETAPHFEAAPSHYAPSPHYHNLHHHVPPSVLAPSSNTHGYHHLHQQQQQSSIPSPGPHQPWIHHEPLSTTTRTAPYNHQLSSRPPTPPLQQQQISVAQRAQSSTATPGGRVNPLEQAQSDVANSMIMPPLPTTAEYEQPSATQQQQPRDASGRFVAQAVAPCHGTKTALQLALRFGFALCLQQRQRSATRVAETMESILEKAELQLKAMTQEERDQLWDDIEEFTQDRAV